MSILFEPSEIFKIAVKMEENGEKFYTEAAQKLNEEKIKALFNTLAKEEVSHKETFEEMLAKIDEYLPFESYPGEYLMYLKAYTEKIIFDYKKIEKEMANINDVSSALDFAINRELDSILYYNEIKKSVIKSRQDLIDKIIEEERKHFLKLSDTKKSP